VAAVAAAVPAMEIARGMWRKRETVRASEERSGEVGIGKCLNLNEKGSSGMAWKGRTGGGRGPGAAVLNTKERDRDAYVHFACKETEKGMRQWQG